MRCQA